VEDVELGALEDVRGAPVAAVGADGAAPE